VCVGEKAVQEIAERERRWTGEEGEESRGWVARGKRRSNKGKGEYWEDF